MDPAPVPTPRRSGSPWALILGLGCGGCLLVIIFFVAGGVFLFRAGSDAFKEVDPVARKFAGHVLVGETDSAYSMISRQWNQTSTRKQFSEWVEHCRKQIGGQPTLTFSGYNFYSGTGGRRESVTYRVTRGDRAAIMPITLVRESGQIRIAAATFTPAPANSD